MLKGLKFKFTYPQIIAISFIGLILTGGFLLMLPFASRGGEWTNAVDAIFTATSATCVTGLVVYDTFTYWSVFGQLVILCLIQIGGLGLMTVISMLMLFSKHKINLYERKLLVQSSGALKMSGIVTQIKRILIGTFIFEFSGAILLATQFCPRMGFWNGAYKAVFHSVSAFCNAGFDLMGEFEQFSSFTAYYDNIVVNFTIMALIVIGGIGFLVWEDVVKRKFRLNKYQLHSKIVLSVTAILILGGGLLFFLFEKDGQLAGMPTSKKILASLFQSVTTRTAGFNTIDMSKLAESSVILSVILMVIGGSPGSTAGGLKTTTFAVLVIGVITIIKNRTGIHLFKRRLDDSIMQQACSIATVYILVVVAASMVICAIEGITAREVVFEVASAIGTVGLSMGVTPTLGAISKVLLALIMFTGRIGGLTFGLVIAANREYVPIDRPVEKILIG